ncbi:E3 ubiquitin-protein ligase E3D [Aplysia californica]|uniref:E3 ubiquitin-protein ligase E3D n=1 Tax=Aplysia californica TaxID=6500 RepID=A0ABM0JA88_APLCA|nr:E3 ubiquitin-protein ligase E3D [Aplysia californica]
MALMKPSVSIRAEFKPLLSSANIYIEFSRELICVSSRVIVEQNKIIFLSGLANAEFILQSLTLKPETCRGLRWIGTQELQLTLEAEWTEEGNKSRDVNSHKFNGGYQHINQDLLVSRIQACQSRCFCVGCGAQIFKPSCNFKRVLPLPSENWSDFADIWFCHNHDGHGHGHTPEATSAPSVDHTRNRDLLPRPDDCLVSSLYMLVSSGQIKTGAVCNDKDKLICNRCGNFLGFVKRAKSSEVVAESPVSDSASDVYKVYYHAICFRQDSDKELLPKSLTPDDLNSDTEKKLLSEQTVEEFMCHLLRDQSHRFTSFRFIVDASLQFEGQSGVIILLWLLDQDLVVFSSASSTSSSSPLSSSPNASRSYSCSPCESMKLLYKADFLSVNGCVDKQAPDVFKAWRKDNTVHSISLPYPLCKQLLRLLITSTKKLSVSQRGLNGFHVGYLTAS